MDFKQCKKKIAITLPLLFASFVVAQCPCGNLPSCHLDAFLLMIATSLLFVMIENMP
jgi:hypothetical protein